MTRTEQVFAESGADVPAADRSYLIIAANRACNMSGGRFSDNLRFEIRSYQEQGRDFYMQHEQRATAIVRGLGY